MFITKSGKDLSKIILAGYKGQETSKENLLALMENMGEINGIHLSEPTGISVEVLAQVIKDYNREDLFIIYASKKRARPVLEKEINSILEALDTDYIDMVEFSGVKEGFDKIALVEDDGVLDASLDLKKEGKISYIGASTVNLSLAEELAKHEAIDALMVPYNLLEIDRTDLYKGLAEKKSLIIQSPWKGRDTIRTKDAVALIGGADFAQGVVFNFRDEKELAKLRDLMEEGQDLDGDKLKSIKNIVLESQDFHCRQCGTCMNCTVKMDIPKNLQFNIRMKENDLSVLEEIEEAKINFTNCIKCGACELRCPYQIPVREIHKESKALLGELKDGN